jgi:hypothetical protein
VTRTVPLERQQYLDRLRDLLPARESRRVVEEIDAMILDRVESAEQDGTSPTEAERRAIAALGSPEALADRIVGTPVTIDLATRRSFVRWLFVVFAGHLLLSVVLTAAGAEGSVVPRLLGPLPTESWMAFVGGVLSVFLIDVGALFAVFALRVGRRTMAALPFGSLRPSWEPRDSVLSLVVLGVAAAVFNPPVRDVVFAIRHQGASTPILSADLVALVPWVNVILGLAALRNVLTLARRRVGPLAVGVDAFATLGTVALLVVAVARPDYVRLPPTVDAETAAILADLATRGLLLVFVLAAFFLSIRLVRRVILLRHLV